MMRGVLYLVGTPIGNLEDISFRALRTLKEVDLIAAEDTRKTGKLLSHYEIGNRLTSYHDYNKERRTPGLIESLLKGKSVAVVSDAGSPGISDPCYFLVRRAIEEDIPVVSIPGPSSAISALTVSGLPSDRFVFEGFLPKKDGKRKKKLKELKEEKRTVILYESPFRLLKTLTDLKEVLGDRNASLSRELTKKFEETKRGKLSELSEYFKANKPKGEFVIVLEGNPEVEFK